MISINCTKTYNVHRIKTRIYIHHIRSISKPGSDKTTEGRSGARLYGRYI